ncbi:MAG: four helix bundle protein [Candidatus Omnitrophica bacterium]|nr:four helix bundle protein [Candidatus Omnitrophota bacterium]
MAEDKKAKKYDLEERTYKFAVRVRNLLSKANKPWIVQDDMRQLLRASGSVGANYIEANESLGKKDFTMRIKICRKEAKESRYWLRLIETACGPSDLEKDIRSLIQEATELMNIFGSILRKSI